MYEISKNQQEVFFQRCNFIHCKECISDSCKNIELFLDDQRMDFAPGNCNFFASVQNFIIQQPFFRQSICN